MWSVHNIDQLYTPVLPAFSLALLTGPVKHLPPHIQTHSPGTSALSACVCHLQPQNFLEQVVKQSSKFIEICIETCGHTHIYCPVCNKKLSSATAEIARVGSHQAVEGHSR